MDRSNSRVKRPRLAAVPPATTPKLFEARPAWAYPEGDNTNQGKYLAAIQWLRAGDRSRWVMDQGSVKPKWNVLNEGAL